MKKISLVILICLMACSFGRADEATNEVLFDKANNEFTIAAKASAENKPEEAKEAYLRAAEIFTQIIRNGTKNSEIYYNLGNCYYQAEDYPMAILQYRRALIYAPDDENTHSNLASAYRKLGVEDTSSSSSFLSRITSANSSIPLFVKEYFNKISYALFWGGLIGFLFLRKRVARKKFLIIAIVWWLSLCAVALVSYMATANTDGIVLKNEVVARKGDGENYSEAFLDPLKAGTEFTLLEKRGDWLKVELTTGNKCWIKSEDAGLVRDEP